MLTVYPAIFHEEDRAYWVEFPDLEGCQTFGDTLQETIELASEALGLYIASNLDRDLAVANPMDISKILTDNNSFANYIYCDVDKYRNKNKAVKKTLTIPQWLNEEAEKQHINFSSVLKDALLQELRQ